MFLFAYDSELTLDTITDRLDEATAAGDGRTGESLDAVFILKRGYVMNLGDASGSLIIGDGSGNRLTGYRWDDRRSPLLVLMMWLPTALMMPLAQLPALSNYLLRDVPPSPSGPA